MKHVMYIGPTVPDGMDSMIRDGFRRLGARWPGLNFVSDSTLPGFYRRCKRADIVLIATNQGTRWRMIRDIAKVHNRWAIIDGSDYSDFKAIRMADPASAPLIFKREYYPELHDKLGNVVPLSFSMMGVWQRKPKRGVKFLNCSFAGREYPFRKPYMDAAKALGDQYSVISSGGLNAGQYWALIQASKICMSLRGAGWDCVRTYEILSQRDCLLMLEKAPVKMSDPPFVDGKHCVMFNTPEEFSHKLAHYSHPANDHRRRQIAHAGRDFAFRHHTSAERARYILKTCLQRLKRI